MKIYYEVIEILGCILAYMYSLYSINIFCDFKKNKTLVSFALSILYIPLTYDRMLPIDNTLASFIAMIFVYLISLFCFNGNAVLKAVIILTYNLLSIILSAIFYSAICGIFNYSLHSLLSTRSIQRTIIIICLYLLEFLILFLVKQLWSIKTKSTSMLNPSEIMLTIFLLLIDFIFAFFSFCIIFYTHEPSLSLAISCCAISIFCLINVFLTLYLTYSIHRKHYSDIKNSFLELEISDYQKKVWLLEENIKSIAKINHDFKNQLLSYKILLENKEYHTLHNKICNQIGSYSNVISNETITKNIYFNSLLNEKIQNAQNNNIKFDTRIIMSSEYQNIPIMIALSNLIDNAIEYEQQLPEEFREIKVVISQDKHSINFSIRNYIISPVLKTNPNLLSSKKNHYLHGYGVSNARSIINAQNGILNFSEEDNYFYAQIFLPI